MKGEMYMLIDKEEMLNVANMYLNYMLHEKERTTVEAVDFKQRRFGREKRTFFEIRIKPVKIQAKTVDIPPNLEKKVMG